MSIHEIVRKKRELSIAIYNLLHQFEYETDLRVESVDLDHAITVDGERGQLVCVDLDVRL